MTRLLQIAFNYLMGISLVIFSYTLDFQESMWAHIIPVVVGVTMITIGAFTSSNISLVKMLSLKENLMINIACGVILFASPWVFVFSNEVYFPHSIAGLVIVFTSYFTYWFHFPKKLSLLSKH